MTEPNSRRTAPRRPGYLVATILALWVVSAQEAQEAFGVLSAITDPLFGATLDLPVPKANLAAVRLHYEVLAPAYAAQFVINVTLFVIAARLLFTGRTNVTFTVQVIGVNALVLAYAYYVSVPLRAAVVRALMAEASTQKIADSGTLWWTMRTLFGLEMLTLGTCVLAITRPASREYIRWSLARKRATR